MDQALFEIQRLPEIQLVSKSRVLETPALENVNQANFLNQVVKIHVSPSFTLPNLLQSFQAIETKLGRQKRAWKGPREIDIDILSYECIIMETEFLTLPHHSLITRPFIKQLLEEMGESDLIQHFWEILNEKYNSRI